MLETVMKNKNKDFLNTFKKLVFPEKCFILWLFHFEIFSLEFEK